VNTSNRLPAAVIDGNNNNVLHVVLSCDGEVQYKVDKKCEGLIIIFIHHKMVAANIEKSYHNKYCTVLTPIAQNTACVNTSSQLLQAVGQL